MYVVALIARKGGVGKTTLSGHLAVEAERMGHGPVALIDTDPQATLTDWWSARQTQQPRTPANAAPPAPELARSTLSRLTATLRQLREAGTALVVIDTPPALSEAIAAVIRIADLVLVPTRPSPHDLRSVGSTLDLVESAGKPVIFILNGATRRARMTGEAAILLSQHGRVSPVIVHHRVDFASSMINGLTVGELDAASSSAREIAQLWDYVGARMRSDVHTPTREPVNG